MESSDEEGPRRMTNLAKTVFYDLEVGKHVVDYDKTFREKHEEHLRRRRELAWTESEEIN